MPYFCLDFVADPLEDIMRTTLTIAACALLAACSAEPGSERWCAAKKEQPKSEWSVSDAGTYAKNCVIDGMEIGSEKWCKKMDEKPKGDWTANEGRDYVKYCLLDMETESEKEEDEEDLRRRGI